MPAVVIHWPSVGELQIFNEFLLHCRRLYAFLSMQSCSHMSQHWRRAITNVCAFTKLPTQRFRRYRCWWRHQAHSLCSFKAIIPRSSPNVAPQGMRRDHLSVHRLVVQRIHEEWPGTKIAKGSIYIMPLLKKPTLDSNDINNYRSISNLSVLSKLLKAVCKQLVSYLGANNCMPRNQSAYHRNH